MKLPKKKKIKSSKKHKLENPAPLYTEDIGTAGIKTNFSPSAHTFQPSIAKLPLAKDEDERRKKRMKRFSDTPQTASGEPDALFSSLSASRAYSEVKASKKKDRKSSSKAIVGTSTALEKPYLRLTDFPKPENVRPLPVLRKALAHIKERYIATEDFDWSNEQLKSVRQDLTVQHIRNDFVLEVYETHARILLEHGDLNEFHQCQTMLRSLTAPSQAIAAETTFSPEKELDYPLDDTTKEMLKQKDEYADEFFAYGLLYHLIQNSWGEITLMLATSKKNAYLTNLASSKENSKPISSVPKCRQGHATKHALQVVNAVMHDDYQSFFRLYESPPHLSAYLMDFLIQRVRKCAYTRIIAAHRPSLSVEHFRECLCFVDLEETRRFLKSQGSIFIHELGAPPFFVDCKATFLATARVPVGIQR